MPNVLFEVIEKYSFDTEKNGYLEALTRDWCPIEDMRLSDKDENEKKNHEYAFAYSGTLYQSVSRVEG